MKNKEKKLEKIQIVIDILFAIISTKNIAIGIMNKDIVLVFLQVLLILIYLLLVKDILYIPFVKGVKIDEKNKKEN